VVTLGIAFMIADACLMAFTGDPITVPTPPGLVGAVRGFGLIFPIYRLVVILIAVVIAVALWLLLDRTRLGAMIRAGSTTPTWRVSSAFRFRGCSPSCSAWAPRSPGSRA
jgi:Branched-chain amino acid ABC-type transport system, permease components